jgi:hypothetical protein
MRDIVASLSHETWLISRNVDASKKIFLWQRGFGAADKAAVQQVKVPSCQLPDSGT